MGWLPDFVEDAVDSVADVASDIGGGIADAAVAVGEAVADGAGEAGGYLGDGIGFAGGFVDTVTLGGASAVMDVLDDTVLDGVDYVTGGVVDIDYDDGKFGASVGIDGLAGAGLTLGEDGVTAMLDTGLSSTEIGLTDDGFAASVEGGINFGPLPYGNGHVNISDDGEISINGHIQGTIPIPGGILSGQASGGFVRTDEGWGAYVDADGTYTLPSGTKFGAGIQASYQEDEDGSRTTFGVEGSVSSPGMGSVGGGYGYERIEEGDNVFTHHEASGYAEGFGIKASAEAEHVSIETPEGSFSQTRTDFELDGLDADSLKALGQSLLGADAKEVDAVLGAAADQGALNELVGSLDAATTTALIERLVAGPKTGATTRRPRPRVRRRESTTRLRGGHRRRSDDARPTPASSRRTSRPRRPAPPMPRPGGRQRHGHHDRRRPPRRERARRDGRPDGTDAPATERRAGPDTDPLAATNDPCSTRPIWARPTIRSPRRRSSPLPVEPAPVEAPVDDFDASIAAADQVETDTDAMFDGLDNEPPLLPARLRSPCFGRRGDGPCDEKARPSWD